MVLYMTDLSYSGGYEGLATATVGASYGVYIGIVGAVLMILGGIGDIARNGVNIPRFRVKNHIVQISIRHWFRIRLNPSQNGRPDLPSTSFSHIIG